VSLEALRWVVLHQLAYLTATIVHPCPVIALLLLLPAAAAR
jgi:hypothetical protein